ncbi:5-(carboxyamino)imidazole ribonucleotide synthase [Saccharophagus degradans]|uniref:5-(carboxyamino)imidazole ribonucleotide synthase n=1 Tax=Saccharophagus degradans TaxID=86304 RepID=UPI0024782E97|nr:5-(carboxyamino)imidazole ribonucleotide synthase [Saccharophagus degradans]WGO99752.1 5-(carboxyamino)imidazole ribonucleotide synthase [Saccharophagus degradans]
MRVGILGGGQLAQMIAQAGANLDMSFKFISPDPKACAAPYGEHICADYQDEQAYQQMLEWADVFTYEFESIPKSVVESLEKKLALLPSSKALNVAGDRLKEKRTFNGLGIPTANFAPVDSLESLQSAVEEIGLPAILKTRSEGYDGKGQAVLRDVSQLEAAWQSVGQVPCILESMVNFSREVSIIAARSKQGEIVYYPLTENHHREGILRLSLPLQNDPYQQQAEKLAKALLDELDYVGVIAVELFQVGESLVANEFAPRVHNSGHWTIEGAHTSQFENHLRAICGLPLGKTDAINTCAMVNIIGKLPREEDVAAIDGARFHDYSKGEKPGRKIGHITITSEGLSDEAFKANLKRILQLVGEDPELG